MAYIFLDESGDLGFDFAKQRTTKFFLITFLFTDSQRPIEKLIREIHRNLRKKYRVRGGTLHAVKEEPVTIMRFCRAITGKQCSVMTIYLDKAKVYTRLRDEKQVLYNYVVNILLDRIMNKRLVRKDVPIKLIASRRETNKFLNKNFVDYLPRQLVNNHDVKIEVEIKTPAEEKCLQAVDLLSWAIFRKYEHGDSSYYEAMKSIIVEENSLYK